MKILCKLNIVPSLAESWKIFENVYVFNLRKGVTWHDGKPFGPEDVKFSFENIISKYDIFGATCFKNVKVEILNETAVKLKLEQLLDSWMREKSPEKQTELRQKLEEILTSELPYIPLYNVVFLNVKSRNIKSIDIPVGRYVFWDPLVNTYIYEETVTTPPTTITTVVTTTVITTVTTTTATTTTTPPAQPDYTFIVAIGIIILVAVLAVLLLRRKR